MTLSYVAAAIHESQNITKFENLHNMLWGCVLTSRCKKFPAIPAIFYFLYWASNFNHQNTLLNGCYSNKEWICEPDNQVFSNRFFFWINSTHSLGLQVRLEPCWTLLSSSPRLFEATKRQLGLKLIVGVYPEDKIEAVDV